jgi:hypothetical protein
MSRGGSPTRFHFAVLRARNLCLEGALKGLSVKECQYWWCTKLLGAPPSSPVASMSMAAAPGCRWLRQSLTVTCA